MRQEHAASTDDRGDIGGSHHHVGREDVIDAVGVAAARGGGDRAAGHVERAERDVERAAAGGQRAAFEIDFRREICASAQGVLGIHFEGAAVDRHQLPAGSVPVES